MEFESQVDKTVPRLHGWRIWLCFVAYSEEIEANGLCGSRQGVLGDSESWTQGVGARRITQRYVGE